LADDIIVSATIASPEAEPGVTIDSTGKFVAASTPDHTGTILTAQVGELAGTARVRVVPALPWKFDFANNEVPWAMGTDQLASTRPIEYEVNAPEEVDQMFDAITYGKGSAVLHMIDEFIGVETFRQGVGDYLREHAYGNTVTNDLWRALDGASEWPVSQIMDTWVYQRGFPQIELRPVDGGVRLAQRRYLVIPDETDTTIWKVPLQLRGSVEGEGFARKVLLEDDEMVVDLGGKVDWVVANAGGHGFYRTSYAEESFSSPWRTST
jgi:aminopeptidase N